MTLTVEQINRREVLQYLAWRGSEIPPEIDRLIDASISEICKIAQPRLAWRKFMIQKHPVLSLPEAGLTLPGKDISALLTDCESCVLMAVTLGAGVDRCITMAEARNLSRAMILDCCASAAVESICDAAENEIEEALGGGFFFTDRFSPGYGDLPLDIQFSFLHTLDTSRRIGLTLTDTNLMIPRKSVTAVLGIAPTKQAKRFRGCSVCNMFDRCVYRKAGKTCGK